MTLTQGCSVWGFIGYIFPEGIKCHKLSLCSYLTKWLQSTFNPLWTAPLPVFFKSAMVSYAHSCTWQKLGSHPWPALVPRHLPYGKCLLISQERENLNVFTFPHWLWHLPVLNLYHVSTKTHKPSLLFPKYPSVFHFSTKLKTIQTFIQFHFWPFPHDLPSRQLNGYS